MKKQIEGRFNFICDTAAVVARVLSILAVLCGFFDAPVSLATHDPSRSDASIHEWIGQNLNGLIADYERVHANPELSGHEERTAEYVATSLRDSGYRVISGLGGYGVTGVLENGEGPTVLIRGDMDALPVKEETGLAYASRVVASNEDGIKVGVMHACGHDIHTVNLVAVARFLSANRDLWSGTIVAIGQPAEELGAGARLMIDDGLFDKVPRPDFSLALHVDGDLPAGKVGIVPGWAFANVDSVDVVIHGRGGHGARPHQTVDPIVAAASYVMNLQTLVSRRINPTDPAVVTVGSFRAGAKHNVIPDSARLQLTVRSYSDAVRDQLIAGIGQLAADTCRQFLCPREPEVTVREHHTPSVYNDPELSRRARDVFAQVLGPSEVKELEPAMVGEDFGRYARHLEIPGLLYRLGSVEAEVYQRSLEPGEPPLPSLHSARYQADPRPTLRTGFRSMAALVLDLLGAGRADSNVLSGVGGRAE